jgi:isopenicillin N synthase-like dioxygenase
LLLTAPAITPVDFRCYSEDLPRFAQDLGSSFARYGFAVISGHDLDQGRIQAALASAKAFFALPDETKRAYHRAGGAGQRGYTPFGVETAKGTDHFDLKEFWHVGRDLAEGHPYRAVMPDNVWPDEVADFQATQSWLYGALDDLGGRVLRAIAITLLLGAEEAGLEVLDRDGRWLAINPPPGSVVCNIGDMLARATNHVLPSTTHRVVNPAPERRGLPRYSMPFFLHFAPDHLIETLPGCANAANPDRYPQPITADAFLKQRLREIKLL